MLKNSESCDKCKNELVACCCMEEDISPMEEDIKKYYHCSLLHSKIPTRTDEGIIWVCKEGCNENVNKPVRIVL